MTDDTTTNPDLIPECSHCEARLHHDEVERGAGVCDECVAAFRVDAFGNPIARDADGHPIESLTIRLDGQHQTTTFTKPLSRHESDDLREEVSWRYAKYMSVLTNDGNGATSARLIESLRADYEMVNVFLNGGE